MTISKLFVPPIKLLLSCIVLTVVLTLPVKGATTLNTGDIAVIGISGDTTDEFAWVPLVNLDAGTKIYFTDFGFFSVSSDFSTLDIPAETLILYTVPAGGVSAGAVQNVIDSSEGANYTFIQAAGWGQTSTPTSIDLSHAGDTIYAFQSSTTPTSSSFGLAGDINSTGLFAVNSATTDWTASTLTTTSSVQSNLYPDLTDGINAVAVGASANADDEIDNVRYKGPTSGTAAELLAAIANSTNWEGSNDTQLGGYTNNGVDNFTVTPVPEPGTIAFLAGFGICAVFLLRNSNRSFPKNW